MKDYYESCEKNETLDYSDLLTAIKAREMTNNAVIELIKNHVLTEVEKLAKRGFSNHSFTMFKDIEYKVGINFLKEIGYETNFKFKDDRTILVSIKW